MGTELETKFKSPSICYSSLLFHGKTRSQYTQNNPYYWSKSLCNMCWMFTVDSLGNKNKISISLLIYQTSFK